MFNLLVDASSYDGIDKIFIILQSLYDLVPIALFFLGSLILLKALYNKMVKGAYVLLSGGIIMVLSAGLLKALHKFLIGALEIDYTILDKQFTPTQSIGFLLIFLGLIGMFTKYNKNYTKVRSSIIPLLLIPSFLVITEYDSSLPFIIMMVIGATGILSMLIYISCRLKNTKAIIAFSIAIIAMLGMGYLSSGSTFSRAWIQISVNIIYQGMFFLGALFLKNSGLGEENSLYRE